MKRALSMTLALCLAAAALPAAAAGWIGLLRNTPAEYYDDEDLHMFLDAARKSLNADTLPPEEVAWRNPATESGGRFLELSRSTTADGRQCKRVRMWMEAKRRSEKTAVMSACKDTQGRWRLGTAQTAPKN